jgi:UDP-glucose 4-epimerase
MRVAVTGGSGQLGTHVLRRLVADETIESIVSLDKRWPSVRSDKLFPAEGDVRGPGLEKVFEGCEALFHFAFVVTAVVDRDVFWGVNVEGTKNVLRAAVKAGVKTVVYSSSIAAYGVVAGHPVPIVEETPRVYQPSFPYSATKFEVEAFLDELETKHPEMSIARLRPTILIGEKIEHGLGRMLEARTLPASGSAPFPIVWDEDVADAAMLAMRQRARGAFNVSAEDLLSPAELALRTGLKPLVVPKRVALAVARLSPWLAKTGLMEAMDPAWVETTDVVMIPSCEKARRELGWAPKYPTAVSVIEKYLATVPRNTQGVLAKAVSRVRRRFSES